MIEYLKKAVEASIAWIVVICVAINVYGAVVHFVMK